MRLLHACGHAGYAKAHGWKKASKIFSPRGKDTSTARRAATWWAFRTLNAHGHVLCYTPDGKSVVAKDIWDEVAKPLAGNNSREEISACAYLYVKHIAREGYRFFIV